MKLNHMFFSVVAIVVIIMIATTVVDLAKVSKEVPRQETCK